MTNWYWQREGDSLAIREVDENGEDVDGDYVAEIDVRYMTASSPDFGKATQQATEIINAHNARQKETAS